MPKSLTVAMLAILIGCGMTTIGFVATGPIGSLAMAPGATISFWLYSGRVHEVGYAIGAIAMNFLVYAGLAYVCISLYGVVRSASNRKKGTTLR